MVLKHKDENNDGENGLIPPKITVHSLIGDLRWHLLFYKEDGLSFNVVIFFLFLRLVQRISYNLGWWNSPEFKNTNKIKGKLRH